jgi:hypothetical protein
MEGENIEGAQLVRAELLADDDMVRHDPDRLAVTVLKCAETTPLPAE